VTRTSPGLLKQCSALNSTTPPCSPPETFASACRGIWTDSPDAIGTLLLATMRPSSSSCSAIGSVEGEELAVAEVDEPGVWACVLAVVAEGGCGGAGVPGRFTVCAVGVGTGDFAFFVRQQPCAARLVVVEVDRVFFTVDLLEPHFSRTVNVDPGCLPG
jgi:hypothetical protein